MARFSTAEQRQLGAYVQSGRPLPTGVPVCLGGGHVRIWSRRLIGRRWPRCGVLIAVPWFLLTPLWQGRLLAADQVCCRRSTR